MHLILIFNLLMKVKLHLANSEANDLYNKTIYSCINKTTLLTDKLVRLNM